RGEGGFLDPGDVTRLHQSAFATVFMMAKETQHQSSPRGIVRDQDCGLGPTGPVNCWYSAVHIRGVTEDPADSLRILVIHWLRSP
ncbi:MAG: hypothetical protein LUO86_07690, partial [Methanomicrobiales archaeon]|nr:hypothetical protein [Methanomicrobiales archaeon]